MAMTPEEDIESAARALFERDRVGTDQEGEKWEDATEGMRDVYRAAVS